MPDGQYVAFLEQLHRRVVDCQDAPKAGSLAAATTGPEHVGTDLYQRLIAAESCLRLLENVRRGGDHSPSERFPVKLPEKIGPFRILRWLGEGSYGVVLLGYHERLQRSVAVKIPRLEALFSPQWRERFLREARAAAALNHPHIVPVFEEGHDGSVYYIASAYVDGPSLADWLKQPHPPLDPQLAAYWIEGLADAIQHAHSRGVLHRDLKPSNLLLQPRTTRQVPQSADSNGLPLSLADLDLADPSRGVCLDAEHYHVLITDFGLAKLEGIDPLRTQTGTVLGTPAYMSPEQAGGMTDELGPATDIYSLGAILYELLAQVPPFQAESLAALLERVRSRDPRPVRQHRAGVPRDLEAICLKCLEKLPQRRYESAAALVDDLRRFRERRPVIARHASAGEKLWRWCRRRPFAALATTLILGLMVTIAILSSVSAMRLAELQRRTLAAFHREASARKSAAQSAVEARLAEGNALRQANRQGQRTVSMGAIRDAMELSQEVPLAPARRLELRNEAIAALSLVDLEPNVAWPVTAPADCFLATDRDCEHYVVPAADFTQIVMRRLVDNEPVARFPLEAGFRRAIGFRFSPCGRWLGARLERQPGQEWLQLWSVADARSLGTLRVGGFGSGADFSEDGSVLALCSPDRDSIALRSLPDLSTIATLGLPTSPVTVRLHPSRPFLACYRTSSASQGFVEIRDVQTGELFHSWPWSSYVYTLDWNAAGDRLAIGTRDAAVRIVELDWDHAENSRVSASRLQGHSSMVVQVDWHPNGSLLASYSMDGTTQLWSVDSGIRRLTVQGMMTSFSRDGTWLGSAGGRWRVHGADEYRQYPQPDCQVTIDAGFLRKSGKTSQIDFWEALPAGRLLIGMNFFQAVFRDVARDEPLAVVPFDGCGFRFAPDGKSLYAISLSKGLSRLPVTIDERVDEIRLTLGPPEHLMQVRPGPFAVGQKRVVVSPFLGTGCVIDLENIRLQSSFLPAPPMLFFCDLAPGDQLAATGTFKGRGIRIRDPADGKLLRTLPAESASVWFSPQGDRLIAAENGRLCCFDTNTWQVVHELSVISGGILPNAVGFSADGGILACEDGTNVRLLSLDDFTELACFRVPRGQLVDAVRLMPGGDYLVVGGGDGSQTHVWNLRLIRAQLKHLQLDWEDPPVARTTLPQLDPGKPLRLNLLLGDLAERTGSASLARGSLRRSPEDSSEANPARLMAQAEQRYRGRYYVAADKILSRLLQEHPDWERRSDGFYLRGRCRAERSSEPDLVAAVQDWRSAVEFDPNHGGALHELTRWSALTDSEEVDAEVAQASLRTARRAVAELPGDARRLTTLGLANLRCGRLHAAIAEFSAARTAQRAAFPAMPLLGQALALARLNETTQAGLYLAAADEWKLLSSAIATPQEVQEYELLRAQVSWQRESPEQIGSRRSNDISANPPQLAQLRDLLRAAASDNADRLRRRLPLLHALGMFHAALLDADILTQQTAGGDEGRYWRGLSWLELEQFERAERDLKLTLARDAWRPAATRVQLARVYLWSDEPLRDGERALSLIREVSRQPEGDSANRILLALANHRVGRHRDALQILGERVPDRECDALLLEALCHARMGNRAASRRAYSDAMPLVAAARHRIEVRRLLDETRGVVVPQSSFMPR